MTPQKQGPLGSGSPNKTMKNIALVLLIVIMAALTYEVFQEQQGKVTEIHYSRFLNLVETESLSVTEQAPLTIQGHSITGKFFDKDKKADVLFKTVIPYVDDKLLDLLKTHKVKYFKGAAVEESFFWRTIMPLLPWIAIVGFFWFMMARQVQSTGNRALTFGKSRPKMGPDMKNRITFADVAGVEEAKEELKEVVDFLKAPQKFQAIGAKIPRGVLLVGPPGTGKTLLAKAVAGEAGVPFFSISGSDFVEMFVGVGASRVRDLFGQAKRQTPCIVFIDEIDAVGRLRGAGLGGGHDEREQTLNQLLVEMDGFEENEGIIIIAATNRADVLDPALLRPGRFDRQVVVDTPDIKGREAILKIHSRKVPMEEGASMDKVARGTPGFTGADLANLINEAALLAARNDRKKVTEADLDNARDKVLMGPERKSFLIIPEEKKIIAYHEAGHAILGELLEHSEEIHKVTIIPRGRALGITQHLPEQEKHMRSRNYWLDQLVVLMGGRLAEEIEFEDVTTGASNDIERATNIARRMVTEWGMSDRVGPIHLSGSDSGAVFLGRDYSRKGDHSEEYAKIIDIEVKRIIDTAFERGRTLLKKNKKRLDQVAQALLDRETITGDELRDIMNGRKLKPLAPPPPPEKSGDKKPANPTPSFGGDLLSGAQPA
ncbi:MAG: ATP-dependent zinc metalloprotease FtsH [Spirochaetes bacterium]|nr:ATP-dependent zinc metalloprotease FtsH [Spirochaetota bacterium]MBX3721603.1 ATP-dependent zinc metalloprotease FtsH [Turneriella sp.]